MNNGSLDEEEAAALVSHSHSATSVATGTSTPAAGGGTSAHHHHRPQTSSFSIEIPASAVVPVSRTPTNVILRLAVTTFWEEVWASTELLFQSKLTWLLLMGPIAVIGDSTGWIGEATCFTCAGLALIPCAERCVP